MPDKNPNDNLNKFKKFGGSKRCKTKTRRHKWSLKYKRSIDCNHPKGFSQKQHCKYGRNNNKFTK